MWNWGRYWTSLALVLAFAVNDMDAGSTVPYQAVVLNGRSWMQPPGQDTLLLVDMGTGSYTEIPVEAPDGVSQPTMAVDSSGAVYVLYGRSHEIIPDRGPASVLVRLDPSLSEWTTALLPAVDFPGFMESTPDGYLVFSDEFGFGVINPVTQMYEPTGLNLAGQLEGGGEPVYGRIRVDDFGVVTASAWNQDSPSARYLFRQTPEAEIAERWDPGIVLADFAPNPDGSLIGVASLDDGLEPLDAGILYRLDFETKTADTLFESELLKGAGEIELGSDGSVVALASSQSGPRIVRIDLEMGAAEVIAELDGFLGGLGLRGVFAKTLQPGDADQDLDFDQFDLVQVQQAAKYLTDQPATWGEGDWNGPPGGIQGNPSLGDGLFDQFDIVQALRGAHYGTGPYAALTSDGHQGDDQTSIVYDPGSGGLSVDAPSGVELTSINIDSAAGVFTGDAAANLGGSFDNDTDGNIFKATFGSSFGSFSFGNVAQPGLKKDFVLGDFTVVGSLQSGGDLGEVDLVYVPEPSGTLLGLFYLLAVATCRCRRVLR